MESDAFLKKVHGYPRLYKASQPEEYLPRERGKRNAAASQKHYSSILE
jgi:hypothetical protein